jgi:hypothetical protein
MGSNLQRSRSWLFRSSTEARGIVENRKRMKALWEIISETFRVLLACVLFVSGRLAVGLFYLVVVALVYAFIGQPILQYFSQPIPSATPFSTPTFSPDIKQTATPTHRKVRPKKE